jgi:hypothetical protein
MTMKVWSRKNLMCLTFFFLVNGGPNTMALAELASSSLAAFQLKCPMQTEIHFAIAIYRVPF